jgi:hypothetical protein
MNPATREWVRDIRMVWDNDESTYRVVYHMATTALSVYDLSKSLINFYEAAIDSVLREIPESSVGYKLVREMCFYLPQSVYDTLAAEYFQEMRESA